jgi:perosamine synthetase
MPADVARNILRPDARLRDVMQLLNAGVFGIALIVDADGRLTGVFTDGDVRRALLAGASVDTPAADHMNRSFVAATSDQGRQKALSLLSDKRRHVPILDGAGRPVDLVSLAEIWSVGVSAPYLSGNEMKYVVDCVSNGWISSRGQYVALFEDAVAAFLGARNAVVTSSGTTALQLALAALNVGPGDEVIVPEITFGASANAVLACGARPVFVDISRETWTLDPDGLAQAVTPRTRAVMPVHIYGHPCDMAAIREQADRHGLHVVEDCAEALGARCRGQPVGTFGKAGCFSFFANKVITSGEGGAIVTDDDDLAARLRLLCNHGMDPGRRYWHVAAGFNFRMTNLQAAIGLAQMERVDDFLAHRRAIAARYDQRLGRVPGLALQGRADWADPVCWLYTLLVERDGLGFGRDALMARLACEGVETRPIFPPLSIQPAFGSGPPDAHPIAADIAARGFSLPTSNGMSLDEVDRLCDIVESVVGTASSYARRLA